MYRGIYQLAVLAAIAAFERDRIVERVRTRLARAKAEGKRLGPQPYVIADERFEAVAELSLREAAKALGVGRSVVHRWRLSRRLVRSTEAFAPNPADFLAPSEPGCRHVESCS
jgi:DNA invertase Pin-like site-specific DNA recombinase